MKHIPWWGWAAAFIVVGYVFVKWYSNQSANASTSNPYLNPTASQVPFDNGVQSDLSTATVEDLLMWEQQLNQAAAGSASTVAGTGTSQGIVEPFLTRWGTGGPPPGYVMPPPTSPVAGGSSSLLGRPAA